MKEEMLKLQNGSDIRGVAISGVEGENVNLTEEVCNLLGQAFVIWLSKKINKNISSLVIGVGKDSRLSGSSLSFAFMQGATFQGAKVVDCNLATTPAMFMSLVFSETKYDGSAMLTASHLPYNRNGIKFFDSDGGLEHNDISAILEIASTLVYGDIKSEIKSFDLLSLYANYLKKIICDDLGKSENEKPLSNLKIIVDAGNGAAGFFVDKILLPLGANVAGSQFLTPDGNFPNHIPNPEDKIAMKSIQEATVKSNADLGLIFDTDVDRMSAVLQNGSEINRDAIIAMIASILAPKYPGSTIVTDSVTSDRLTFFLENVLGLKHLRYMRGYKNVINKCKELNASGITSPLAIETSGHGALKDNYYLDDGAFLAVQLIIALALSHRTGKKLDSLIEKMPLCVEECSYRIKINAKDFKQYGKDVLEKFSERAKNRTYNLVQSYEGVRLSFNSDEVQGWLLLRLSLHDPVMPLNIEGNRTGDVAKILAIAKELLNDFTFLDINI